MAGVHETNPTLLVCLPFLAGSASNWLDVAARLGPSFECLPVDLPGFGAAAGLPGYDVSAMADHVAAAVAARAPARWVIAGHSMGAKVALVVAHRAEQAGNGPAGIVLLAGSPPGPEPMEESKRAAMRGWLAGDDDARRADAARYVDGNVDGKLAQETRQRAIDGVLLANRDAWVAWLDGGSREDWAERIGVLQTPALVIAGAADDALGADAQVRLTLPALAHADLVTLPGAGHLLPMERPGEVARLIAERFAAPSAIPAAYRGLIGSERVSARTRDALLGRLAPAPRPVLAPDERAALRALLARVIPAERAGQLDLTGLLEAQLDGPGDGWRPAAVPPDKVAWRAGLRTLARHGLAGLPPAEQDALLDRVAAGEVGLAEEGTLPPATLQAWFEDACAEAARAFVSHPVTMARMGFSGIAYGGDAVRPGFTALGPGQREAWEPVAP